MEGLIQQIFSSAEKSVGPIQSYATNLLATVMEDQEISGRFRQENDKMVPIMRQRLRKLREKVTDNCQIPLNSADDILQNQQFSILRYLKNVGELERSIDNVTEENTLESLQRHLNMIKNGDSQLVLEALRNISFSLSIEENSIVFLNLGGLEELLRVPKTIVTATEVSKCLYHLANHESSMGLISSMSRSILAELVSYALWILLENSSDRSYVLMFFELSFSFRVILGRFHTMSGLNKLLIVLSSALEGLNIEDEKKISNDLTLKSFQTIKHISITLKKFIESLFYYRADQVARSHIVDSQNDTVTDKIPKLSFHEILEKIRIVHDLQSIKDIWPLLDEFFRLQGITILFHTIAFTRKWSSSGQAHDPTCLEIIKSCLNVIANCSYHRGIMQLIWNHVKMPDNPTMMPMDILLDAAKGDVIADIEVQKEALRAIVNCVLVYKYSQDKSSESLTLQVLECIASHNGIVILWELMKTKVPITDADYLRSLAARALAGLARSEEGIRIIHKLNLMSDEELRNLMERPVSQGKLLEHMTFQKYARRLIQKTFSMSPQLIDLDEPNEDENQRNRKLSTINMAARAAKRQVAVNESSKLDRRFIYSQFCPVKTFRSDNSHETFTSVTFSPCQRYLIAGTKTESIFIFNVKSGMVKCKITKRHLDHSIDQIECHYTANLLLTNYAPFIYITAEPTLWNIANLYAGSDRRVDKMVYHGMNYAEFSKRQDKVIGTSKEKARIYDVSTGKVTQLFGYHSSFRTHRYRENKATFCMKDELVLNDGILWDIKSGKEVHRFEKFNNECNGIFHANEREIVWGPLVWDLRTFHLLKNVTILENKNLRISPINHIIYTYSQEKDRTHSMNSFGIVDSFDYDFIAEHTIDGEVKSLACNKSDTQIAIVQNRKSYRDSCLKIYDVGRCIMDFPDNF